MSVLLGRDTFNLGELFRLLSLSGIGLILCFFFRFLLRLAVLRRGCVINLFFLCFLISVFISICCFLFFIIILLLHINLDVLIFLLGRSGSGGIFTLFWLLGVIRLLSVFGVCLSLGLVSIFAFLVISLCDGGLGGLGACLRLDGGLRLDLDRGFEELVQDLVDLAVENLGGDERVLVASLLFVLLRHDGDVVNKDLELVVVEVLDQLVVVVFELLQTVVVIKQFVHGAVLAAQKVLHRCAARAPVVRPEVAA